MCSKIRVVDPPPLNDVFPCFCWVASEWGINPWRLSNWCHWPPGKFHLSGKCRNKERLGCQCMEKVNYKTNLE